MPVSAKQTPDTNPTYPVPITAIFIFVNPNLLRKNSFLYLKLMKCIRKSLNLLELLIYLCFEKERFNRNDETR
jgi:hypothetical protein